ncbi:MAG: carboxypeptidase regulatory-like domain-containing protein [Bryobacterales bacterium]|nr:carboxypeptidase regulatory-like domain-containing protein [Bryobacterales bacterium]
MNWKSIVAVQIALAVSGVATAAAQQSNPTPPPTGNRRDPGFFGGVGQPKKDKKEREEEENTRALAGVVRNEADQLVEGAVVQLKDTKSLKVRSYITKADGVYKFFGLSINADYEIRAEMKDLASEKRTLSVFDSRKQAVINLKLTPQKK